MVTRKDYPYKPDYTVLPGDSLVETLESVSMTQRELASRMGRPLKTINEIIKGKAAITADTALQLERVLGTPASFWVNLERNYREALARKRDEDHLKDQLVWLKRFPVRAMLKSGWIRSRGGLGQIQEILRFFGVASPDQWERLWVGAPVAYRKSAVFQSDPGAVAAWLRMGEIQAQGMRCQPYDAKGFRGALQEIRELTIQHPEVFGPELRRICADSGVAVVFVRELPKIRISGATRWLSPSKALIQLTLRYRSDDQLWFSFFHEAGHILLHGKRAVFIDDGRDVDDKETEANTFAADLLLPPSAVKCFLATPRRDEAGIISFAKSMRVAPGIVVGRLQHDSAIPNDRYNHLKRWLEWAVQPSEAA